MFIVQLPTKPASRAEALCEAAAHNAACVQAISQ
jgi:hypothetical protein